MNVIRNIVVITFFITNWAFAQETECGRIAYFGKTEICLPQINGYRECYTDSIVKQLADKTEVPENKVLGFYLDNETYAAKDSIGHFVFDNYFKVYGTKEIMNLKTTTNELILLQDLINGDFLSENWSELEKKLNDLELGVETGVPVVVKSYNLDKNSFTVVMIFKYEIEGIEPYSLVMTVNGLLIKERVIFMAYYMFYDGKDSIIAVQEKSNLIVSALLNSQN